MDPEEFLTLVHHVDETAAPTHPPPNSMHESSNLGAPLRVCYAKVPAKWAEGVGHFDYFTLKPERHCEPRASAKRASGEAISYPTKGIASSAGVYAEHVEAASSQHLHLAQAQA